MLGLKLYRIVLFLAWSWRFVQGLECPIPASPQNAKVTVGGTTSGSVATYTCDPGYILFGSSSVVCGADGRWSGDLPLCATNVAYRKPVNQSSTARGGNGANANDGDSSTVHDGDRCTQTHPDISPWWAVDLLQSYEVSVVRITSRGCCGHDPPENLEVRVGDSLRYQQNRLCSWLPGKMEAGATKDLKCALPTMGRYVMVQMVGVTGSLSLCEVEVFTQQEVSKDRCAPSAEFSNVATFNRTCYHLQTQEGANYATAKEKCAARNSTLVQHIQPITQQFINSELMRIEPTLDTKLLWIGVEKEQSHISRTWRWIDGSKVENPLWGRDQPNNYIGEQYCVMLDGTRDWLWNDVTCSLNYLHWICQYRPVSCGSPDTKENTTVTVTGQTAQYSCPEGNLVVGNETRECEDTGLWGGDAPSCKYISCPAPGPVENGKVIMLDSRTNYEARLVYECGENYAASGETTVQCGEDGMWQPQPPQCLFSWCPTLETPRNGALELGGRKAGDTATFSCDPGYVMIGSKTVSCQLGGEWTGSLPTCRFVDCSIPDDLEHGEMTLVNGTTYLSSVASYECSSDYWLDGPSTRTCMKDGRWSGEQPFCVLISCGQPEIPDGGYVTGYSLEVNSEVQYYCEEGHYSTGEMTRVCLRDTTWSGVTPNCTFVDCGRVPALIRGDVTYSSEGQTTYLDSTVEFSCISNYRLEGDQKRTCMKDGRWSGVHPKCVEIRCSSPEIPDLARITVTRNDRRMTSSIVRGKDDEMAKQTYRVGTLINYRCDKGYVVEGFSVRSCLANGTWSAASPSCKFVDCGPPEAINPGKYRLLSNSTSYGATVSYECDLNWKIEGKWRRHCQENGTWSDPSPKCIEVKCPLLSTLGEPDPSGGLEVQEGTRSVGSHATYSCRAGYHMVGQAERECLQHGVWAPGAPFCRGVICLEPEEIPNARMIKLNDSTSFGSVVEYLCYPKYYLHGQYQRRCTQDGTWSHKAPRCTLDATDRGVLGDNSIDGAITGAHGDSLESDDSNAGMIAGIIISLLILVLVALGIVFFRKRQSQLKKTETPKSRSDPPRGIHNTAGPVSFGDLNDPTTGNSIYENIPDDLEPDPNYSELSAPPSRNGPDRLHRVNPDSYLAHPGHTYANGGVEDRRPPRPRLPPPQPPTVPTGVTINGMSVNGR